MKREEEFPLGSENNPVRCHDFEGRNTYLGNLVGPEGQEILYKRLGSRKGVHGNIVDIYNIYTKDGTVNQMIYVDMYHKGYREKKPIDGLKTVNDFKKRKDFNKPDYLLERKKEIEAIIPGFKLPDQYVYIWTKAGLLVLMGPYIYSKEDFFGKPGTAYPDQLVMAGKQIVHELNGAVKERPLEVENMQVAVDLLGTFHFEKVESTKMDNNLYAIKFRHLMKEQDEIELFFSIDS